jgi:tRNA-modifying protein YgfZ
MRTSPLQDMHARAGAVLSVYGPPEAGCHVVETYGELELEYAALRGGCILLDQPHRAVLEVTGPDRLSFLNRMVTQELAGLQPMHVRRSFWLNRKGRIDADLRLIELDNRMLIDVDVHAAARTVQGLSAFVVMEDVQITDVTELRHRLALHGPAAIRLLAAAAESKVPLEPDQAMLLTIAGHKALAFRQDTTGEIGLELIVPAQHAAVIYEHLLRFTHAHGPSTINLRPAGWHAFNIGRIEAGTPLYNIDFGPESLPHETGVLRDRVNFKKGCYLGQEIVARMDSRGHSKKTLVAFSCDVADPDAPADQRPLPAAGSAVRRAGRGGHEFDAQPDAPVAGGRVRGGETRIARARNKARHRFRRRRHHGDRE